MTRFTDYEDARAARSMNLVWKHELLDPAGTVLATTDPADIEGGAILWGAALQPLAFQGNRVSQRSAQMTIPVTVPALMPDRPGSLLHPETGNRIRVHAGMIVDGEPVYLPQATMLANDVDGVYESGVSTLSLSLVDALRPLRSETIGAFAFADGEAVESVVRRMMGEVFPNGGYTIAPTGFTTPSGSVEIASKRDRLVTELLEGCGHEITTDPLGQIFSRLILPSSGGAGERWRYGQADGIPVATASRVWSPRVPQGWRVEGGSFQNSDVPVTLVVYDTDPTSEGFFRFGGESQIQTARYPFLKTTTQAAVAGYAQLRRHGVGPMTLTITTIPNPAIREGDLVDLEMDELNATGTYRVMEYRLPIQVDGMMQVTIRQIYDPAIGYRPNGDRGEGCLPDFYDDFDRADQNLEHLESGEAGSPDWTEHGYSWGVVGGRAIQRYEGGWSFAMVNTPICSFNQYATVTIAAIPAGRQIGPGVRGSGEFDGYFALVNPAGLISLELWLNGARMEQFGTYNHGSSLVGSTVTVQAVGPAVTVKVNGSTVALSANDDRCVGNYVGMLGYGGWTGSAPAAEAFESGAAT